MSDGGHFLSNRHRTTVVTAFHFKSISTFKTLFIYLFLCVHIHTRLAQGVCRGQRKTHRYQLYPTTKRDLGLKSKSDLAAGTFPYWDISLAPLCCNLGSKWPESHELDHAQTASFRNFSYVSSLSNTFSI